ncbi:hypothetical protein B0H65DRAFT_286749 [Neurospora tetraspora]|uniref:Uncharacterized protein n=1 Tax=Neurospora tetraspora TaxID=94610 RepID=A0AAE0J8E9_9PEZI|nr:hypothetical protein B0H65DRAFT_286749 [Neurospora tetraspora]
MFSALAPERPFVSKKGKILVVQLLLQMLDVDGDLCSPPHDLTKHELISRGERAPLRYGKICVVVRRRGKEDVRGGLAIWARAPDRPVRARARAAARNCCACSQCVHGSGPWHQLWTRHMRQSVQCDNVTG